MPNTARLPNPAAETRHSPSPTRSRRPARPAGRGAGLTSAGMAAAPGGDGTVGRLYCSGMRYRYVVRIGPGDVGQRVVVRWRRPAPGGGDEVADVVGPLEAADEDGFAVRNRRGELVRIPRERALAAKVVPPR